MATVNGTSSTNNVNQVLWSYSTKLVYHTDRATSVDALHAEIQAVEALGTGVTDTNPFTNLT
jgi:hypothetical protein